MVHLRSRQKRLERRETREEKRRRRQTEWYILLGYSQRDYVNGEICHTTWTELVVYEKLKITFGEGYSPVTANLEYGQVLNRHAEILRSIVSAGKYKH